MSVPASKSPRRGSNVRLSPDREGRAWGSQRRGASPLASPATPEGSAPTGLLQDTARFPAAPSPSPQNVQRGERLGAKEGAGESQCPPPPLLRQLISLSN